MSEVVALPRHIKGVIFDCDGVIINSLQANCAYYNKILEAFGLPPLTEEQIAYTFMSTVPQALEYIVPEKWHHRIPEVCKTVSYQRDIMHMVELNAHFKDFALWLKEKGLRRAVHTNRSSGMQYVVDKFDFLREFSPIVTAADVQPKPHPEGVFTILKAWSLSKEDIIFVGDSLNDQNTAAAAGVAFVAYGGEPLKAAVNVTCYKDLQQILTKHI